MATCSDIPNFNTLLEKKYGKLESLARQRFHRKAIQQQFIREDNSRKNRLFQFFKPILRLFYKPWKNTDIWKYRMSLFGRRARNYSWLIGKKGLTIGKICPGGKARFFGQTFFVYTRGPAIPKGKSIIVIEVVMQDLIVEAVDLNKT